MSTEVFLKFAVVVAGGAGLRMGKALPKQFLSLKGKPILLHTVENWLNLPDIAAVVGVLPGDHMGLWEELAATARFSDARFFTCEGGPTRTESVANGLKRVLSLAQNRTALVAIHDGVRPFFTKKMAEEAFSLAAAQGGAVACVPVKASLRRRTPEGSQAVDRSEFWEVQTPQTFQLSMILSAFDRRPHNQFSDDASLFEWAGGQVAISEGSYANIKITTPEDLLIAAQLLGQE